jgi:hypothetical protein
MMRLWAVILTAFVLAGCRSSQPTTNPFMRTTVPPPGTQGMMVMPGEPYPAGTVPPMTTPGMAPPAVSPAVPVVPGQPAPLIAPPPAGPKQEKFQPPGGSYLYHQSSNDPPRAGAAAGGVQLASAMSPGSVQQAAYVEGQRPSQTVSADQESTVQFRHGNDESLGDPPEKLASVTAVDRNPPNSKLRIVPGSPAAEAATQASSLDDQDVLRMTVGESSPAVSATVRHASSESGQASASRVAFVSQDTDADSQATARFALGGPAAGESTNAFH